MADARFFEHNVGPLAERFHVLAIDQRGHGHTADVEGPLTFDLMAQDTIAFLETVLGRPVHLLGHSNGAFVALLVALRRADLVRRLVLVSGGFHRDGFVRAGDQFDVDAVVAALGSSYGEVSPDGEEHFRVVVEKMAELERKEPALPATELGNVESRTLVMFGDDDLVTMEHANATYEGFRTPSSPSSLAPRTSSFRRSRRCATTSSSSSLLKTPFPRWLRSVAPVELSLDPPGRNAPQQRSAGGLKRRSPWLTRPIVRRSSRR